MFNNVPRQSRKRLVFVALAVAVAGIAIPWRLVTLKAATPPPTTEPASNIVIDYADQINRLVMDDKFDQLADLKAPASVDPEVAELDHWRDQYVSRIETSEKQRDDQYKDMVAKAQESLKLDHYEDAIAQTVDAYTIAKDQEAFLALDWVKDLTAKEADRAADYEKKGQWLESLLLYSDLNTLYKIDTRFKADNQRLEDRTRLLQLYAPQTLMAMREVINAKLEKEHAATQASTQAAATMQAAHNATTQEEAEEESSFTPWQDTVENITPEMLTGALEEARNYWVEQTSYEKLLQGGIGALRLFLTTPELAKVFTGLADADARTNFGADLDAELAKLDPKNPLTKDQFEQIVTDILSANTDTIKLPEKVAVMEFTDGAIEQLDPFTAVIWPHAFDEFDKDIQGHFGGVGIQISEDKGELEVVTPLEDSPAYKAGIIAGDVITAVDGKPTLGMSMDQAVHSIMGKPDTDVVLRIKRQGEPDKDYTVTRAEIQVQSVKGFQRDKDDPTHWDFMIDPENKIGYIRITGFQQDTAQELQNALESLKSEGLRGVILDLRFNPGGLLDVAVKMCDEFIDQGTIVSTRKRVGNGEKWDADGDTVVPTNMPVVVLINQYSASASEIFSGAMKYLHRGLIVGQRSFGKGSVQNLIPLTRDIDGRPHAAIKLTLAYYFVANQTVSLHRRDGSKTWGIEPDVVVPLTPLQIRALAIVQRDADIIHNKSSATAPAAAPATQAATKGKPAEPVYDTQLDTALLLMRLQLIQHHT